MRPRAVVRFLCGRRGAVTARAMIIAWSIIGPICGWIAYEAWGEWKAQRSLTAQIASDLRAYITGATARGDAARARLDRAERDVADLDKRVDDHERRIYRIEGRR